MPAQTTSAKAPREGALPVTILSGFLGSGKTTLLKRLLENREGLRIAALVNDVAAVNIDGAMVASLDKATEVVQLENGCICCTLNESFMHSLLELARNTEIDYCVVESTGVSEPKPVAQTFYFNLDEVEDKNGKPYGDVPFSDFVRLDTCVTVVDAKNFYTTLGSRDTARDKFGEEGNEAERDIAEILTDQMEFADVIIVNKCDLIDEKQAKLVTNAVRAFNSAAQIIPTTRSNVSLSDVVGTNKFNVDTAELDAAVYSISRGATTKSELDEFNISSLVYLRRRPFHPERFNEVAEKLSQFGHSLLRSKGYVWLATRVDETIDWSQCGVIWTVESGGPWMCTLPRDEWPSEDPRFIAKVMEDFDPDPKIGDRRQEIVFIGQGLKEKEIVELLDGCLLTDEEMKDESKWSKFEDPFGVSDDEDEDDSEEGGDGMVDDNEKCTKEDCDECDDKEVESI